MPDMEHAGTADDAFSAVVKKHRASLSPRERQVVALNKMADQAAYVVARAEEVFANAQKNLDEKKAEAAKATADFEAAKAALLEEPK